MKLWNRIKNQSFSKLNIIVYNIVRMSLLGILHRGGLKAAIIQNIHPSTQISVCDGGTIELSHSIFTRRGVTLRTSGGQLKIGTCFFNQGCCVTSLKRIEIGNNCLFGPNVTIVDHDHDYRFLNTKRGSEYICKDVLIGENVVVGANTVILKGSIIGENSIIGAGSIVSGVVAANSIYYSKHEKVQRSLLDKA